MYYSEDISKFIRIKLKLKKKYTSNFITAPLLLYTSQ